MNLFDRVTQIFSRRTPAPVETTADVPLPPGAHTDPTRAFMLRFAAETTRAEVVRICREMYKSDPRAEGILESVARDAVKGGFRVVVQGNPRAEEIANAMVKRLKLSSRMDDWVRLAFRDGDSFLEVSISAGMEIVRVTRKPTLQMHRESDESDSFLNPQRAYWYADEIWTGQAPPMDAIWFADWQIIHARWKHDEGSRYGSPMFGSANGAWKRMKEGEIDISVRRKSRAGMKYLHSLEGADAGELEAYKEANKDALNNPFAAVADFFVNKKATISAVQGDATLSQIEDVLHHIRTWWTASPMPMSLLGYGQDLNRDVLQEQKAQYDETLGQITEWVEGQIVNPLLERQWLLAGILPEGLEYELVWAPKQVITAANIRDAADAALKLSALGLPDEAIEAVLRKFLPGIEINLAQAGEAERIADTADNLRGKV